jgi:hypothetical protein
VLFLDLNVARFHGRVEKVHRVGAIGEFFPFFLALGRFEQIGGLEPGRWEEIFRSHKFKTVAFIRIEPFD